MVTANTFKVQICQSSPLNQFTGETCVVASVYGPNSRSSHRKDFESNTPTRFCTRFIINVSEGVIEVTFKRDDEKEQVFVVSLCYPYPFISNISNRRSNVSLMILSH